MKAPSVLFIWMLLLVSMVSYAQLGSKGGGPGGAIQGEISGQVIDSISGTPMSYVTVSVLRSKDSSMVTGSITNDGGEFIIKDLAMDNYLLKCSFIGYESKWISDVKISPQTPSKDFNRIVLIPDREVLQSVEIVADKPFVVYEIDKKVVNVESMTTVASATALEVLQNIPSITVDMDGNVSLRGSSGFTLLVDNKPVNMEATDALQMIPASNIKDIEIITNPSAKYNAEGTSGIINIILKKDKMEGISTLINANGGLYENYGADFLTSINKEKIKFNVGGNFKNVNQYRDITQIRRTQLPEGISEIEGDGLHRFFRTNYSLNGAMEWSPNRKNSYSLALTGQQRQYNAASDYYFAESLNDSIVRSYHNVEKTLRKFFGYTVSGTYEHLFKGDKEHRLAFTGMYNLNDGNEDALAEYFNGEEVFTGGNRSTELGPSKLYRFNLDYELPLKNKKKFKTGIQTDLGNNTDDQDSYQYDPLINDYAHLDLFSSDVSYKQNVYAGYGIFSGEYKKKLGYQFGIRGEYTDRLIEIANSDQTTKVQRMDWFPSAHFSYSLNDKNQFMINASRRINRPRSWNLEPFITWEDPYTVRNGNPNLLPEYIQSYEVSYVRNIDKGSFSVETYYRNTTNIIERIQEVYDTNVIMKRPVNAGTSKALGAEISYRKNLKKWWTFDVGSNMFYFELVGSPSVGTLSQQQFTYNVRMGNTWTIKKEWKLQLIARYTSREVNIQGRSSDFFTADLALKKDFWEHKLSTSLQVNNLFNSEKRQDWVETPTLYSYRKTVPYWPMVSISASLRLNNYKQQDKIETIEGDEF